MPPAQPLVKEAASKAVDLARLKPLQYRYQSSARPLNCASFPYTRFIAADPLHPLYIRTRRRLDAFDPDLLHWRVTCKVSFSKRKVVRDRAKRRVRSAIVRELHQVGLDPRGRPLPGQTPTTRSLRGAWIISVPDDMTFATGLAAEIQAHAHVTFQSFYQKAEHGHFRSRSAHRSSRAV